jgi:Mg2+ and Co2+ transporter CorA
LAISAYTIGKRAIKQANFSELLLAHSIERGENQDEESLWIHADDPGDILQLQDAFDLDPLAIDAIVQRNQPTKIEEYDTYLFAIIDGVRTKEHQEGKAETREVSRLNYNRYAESDLDEDDLYIFLELQQGWIITINFYNKQFRTKVEQRIGRRFMSSHVHPSIYPILYKRPSLSQDKIDAMDYRTTIEMVYRFAVEEIISGYFTVIDKLATQLEQFEDVLFVKHTEPELFDILLVRKKLGFLESTLEMIIRLLVDIVNGVKYRKLSKDSMKHIEAIYTKVVYLESRVEHMRQRIIALLEAHNSSSSANLNTTMKTLTIITIIFLPANILASIAGMNFDVMPFLHWEYSFYYTIAVMSVGAVTLVIFFRVKKWI